MWPDEHRPGPRPLIMIIDDRPHGLSAMLDAIARRYGGDYRVLAHLSAQAALDELARAKRDGEQVALIIADQWMPEMPGAELLLRAHEIHPHAQRALLVGWGDARANEVVLQGCALNQLDNFILKPWAPPEVHLYPVVNEFLAEWMRMHGPRLELVRIVSESPSPRGEELRDMVERNGIPHGYYTIDSDAGQDIVKRHGVDMARLPAVVMFDGRVLHDPTNVALADSLGVPQITDCDCDLAIVGAGPSGLAAAVNAASEGLSTIVVEREAVGGQAGTSSLIRNFLGFPRGISGADLAQRAYQQAWLFGAKYALARNAVGIRLTDGMRVVSLDDGTQIRARALIVATGAAYRRLGVPQVDKFSGRGVFYTAGADVALALRGQDVVVCGGGNSAGQAVVHLAKSVRRVVLAVRGKSLGEHMSAYLVDEIRRLRNVEVRLEAEVVDANGERALAEVMLRERRNGSVDAVRATALFVMIGAVPYSDWLHGALERDANGFILTDHELSPRARRAFGDRTPMLLETSMPGVFAAGDVRAGSTKRLASAVGEGAVAVRVVFDFLRADVTTARLTASAR
ncbi:MAG TPA: FAD-dependent oxidoreductase [Kofleriaceae bacterium]|nr:FAD-dependent oxidoreductase [Kofleriaceae bacterium]